ncbi:MAG: hypothetical protein H0V35_07565 [Nitrospira sp.]|nr:hypothetical protein [Nitrospira sp.]
MRSRDPVVPAIAALLFLVITFIDDHHTRDPTQKLTIIQHRFQPQILFDLHVHFDHHHCLES